METPKKVRSPNFSTQECMLISQIMGEDYKDFGLSRHKVDKHKFNSSSAPVDSKYTLLTEAVLSVIGKECVSLAGAASLQLDTTLSQLQRSQSRPITFDENGQTSQDGCDLTGLPCTSSAIKVCRNLQKCVGDDEEDAAEIRKLKKRKLQLQVEFLEIQLKKLKEE